MSADRRRKLISELLRSSEPSIRWRTRVRVRDERRSSPAVRELEGRIQQSPRVAALLSLRHARYRAGKFGGIYRYWQGTHWVLTSLVDLGYPAGDPALAPVLDRALGMWTDSRYERTIRASPEDVRGVRDGVPILRGKYRRCASQHGNALLYATALGPLDDRAHRLARWLRRRQWADGGWNCSRSPDAHVSSFMETLAPMRGLAAYAARAESAPARLAAERAAEVFLHRRLFRRRTNGKVMRPGFLRLHYPLYWHYDVLGGLKGMADVGRIEDPRCRAALDWLEERELADGGWPVDERYYRVSADYLPGCEFVDWGAPQPRRRNDWVTTDALYVLRAAGRLGD
jgi:hypothetical protein